MKKNVGKKNTTNMHHFLWVQKLHIILSDIFQRLSSWLLFSVSISFPTP